MASGDGAAVADAALAAEANPAGQPPQTADGTVTAPEGAEPGAAQAAETPGGADQMAPMPEAPVADSAEQGAPAEPAGEPVPAEAAGAEGASDAGPVAGTPAEGAVTEAMAEAVLPEADQPTAAMDAPGAEGMQPAEAADAGPVTTGEAAGDAAQPTEVAQPADTAQAVADPADTAQAVADPTDTAPTVEAPQVAEADAAEAQVAGAHAPDAQPAAAQGQPAAEAQPPAEGRPSAEPQPPAQAQPVAEAQAPVSAAPVSAPDAVEPAEAAAAPDAAQTADPAATQDAVAPTAAQPTEPPASQAGAESPAPQAPEAPQAPQAPQADAPQPAVPVAAAQDAVPTAPTGDGAPEAAEAPEPAVLQAQGPQLAEHAAPAAGTAEAPAAPAVPEQQPQAVVAAEAPAGSAVLEQQPQAVVAAEAPAAPAVLEQQPQAAVAAEAPAAPAAPEQQPQAAAPADAPAGSAVPQQQPQAPGAVDPVSVVGPAGPQLQPSASDTAVAGGPHAAHPEQPLPSGLPAEPDAAQPFGQFVPVEGQVPTTPHLAPTPAQPLVVPAPREGEPAAVPAAPDAEPTPDVVQHAEDLQTRAADQEESTAAVAEARQSTGPAAPGYADADREAVLKVMRERRDIRNGFRSDPIPHEVLLRVLEAAHTAPSVGHSQPWDFVVIRSAETRRTMHELAMRQREAYAKSLPKGRAKQFKELKIEAILDTPVNIVVTADPTRGGRHTLGRHTQPQMAPYSSALAVENLWLAARAEGLGVGWVSFFDEREMVRALGLPEHLEVVAYLCVGYVDEFPDEPELMQAGWSKRRPLSWVVHEETYGRRALPGEEPHDLLAETVAQIRPLDAKALGEAWERQKRMTKPAGALGMLEIISAQLCGLSRQCPPPIPEPAAVAIFAGDHGVHAQGVTPWPQEVTAQMVANFLGGGAVCNAFANQVGAEVCVVDVGVVADLPATPGLLPRKIRGGTSDMTTGPAMTREEAKAAIEVGIETARDLVAAGNKALLTGEMGIANTTASAALISVFTGADPAEVTGRGTGINDETLARKTDVVRRALELHQPDPADPIGVLSAIGGFEHAAMVGLLLGGASLRTPVILDGVSAGAAALVARAIAPEVLAACIAGHRSAEPGHVAALNKLGLRPLVDLDLRLGEGTGALLALPLVQSTARAMHEVATFDSAGVTEK
ncbi:nicotinate-nucleotide--dimethylbenzimidazole phosphoribosyltransferase [Streptomyces tricolor]